MQSIAYKSKVKNNAGQCHPAARFTDKEVEQVRHDFANKLITVDEIAKKKFISKTTVVKLLRGESYRLVGGPVDRTVGKSRPIAT